MVVVNNGCFLSSHLNMAKSIAKVYCVGNVQVEKLLSLIEFKLNGSFLAVSDAPINRKVAYSEEDKQLLKKMK